MTHQRLGQETRTDRELVVRGLKARGARGVRLLVFGCGNDSRFWAHLVNANGTTVFLEDNRRWARLDPSLTTHIVRYHTAPMGRWRKLLQNGDSLRLPPEQVRRLSIDGAPAGLFDEWWDVILIDGPAGNYFHAPGRLAPIFQAAQVLARQRRERPCTPVDVYVHDANRWIEWTAAMLFLSSQARLINYAGLSRAAEALVNTRANRSLYMAWFHSP